MNATIEDNTIRLSNEQDWFLQDLVNLSNEAGVEIGVTLSVGGFLVSGYITTGRKYFEEFAEVFSKRFKGDVADAVRQAYAANSAIYDKPAETKIPDGPTYIHLKDVHFFTGTHTPMPKEDGNWWRGRIRAVDGFVLGTLMAEV